MKRHRRTAWLTSVLLAGFGACAPAVPFDEDYSKSRLMDEVCSGDGCVLEGSARKVEGLTHDSLGFEIGPGPGRIVFPMTGYAVSGARVDVLIEGSGKTTSSSLSESYDWRRADLEFAADGSATAVVEITDGSHAKVADLRVITSYGDGACSVSAPGRSRSRRLRSLLFR